MKKFGIFAGVSWIIGWIIAYYFVLPPINPTSFGFWMFFTPAIVVPVLLVTQTLSLKNGFNKGKALYPTLLAVVAAILLFGGMIVVSPVFNASSYTERITIVNSSFEDDIQEVDFENLPLLDKFSSQKVGDRVVGQIPELVSQFSVSDEYSLINYKGSIVRVTPLEHNGIFKYFANQDGTAGYVIVDTTTGEAELVQTEEGLKYLPSSYFFHNLRRHVQIHYPFSILGESSFELDEEGNPYWIVQTLKYTWVNMKTEVSGIIVVDAVSGDTQRYVVNEIPSWIDNVYDANLITTEIDSWGMYQGGFLNSMFSQKNVVQTTEGYTYITKDDDVYMYTGITSIAMDESNIGFVMVNLRTHEAKYYPVPGAEEYSAMDSAVGAVQEKKYTSTFPLLINLNNRPTYLMSLKDDAGLVKMYAFVDVQNYQKVSVTDASYGIKEAAKNYLQMLGISDYKTDDILEKDITIKEIHTVVVDGTTSYYILTEEEGKYAVVATVDLSVTPFMKAGDTIHCGYYVNEDGLNTIVEIR